MTLAHGMSGLVAFLQYYFMYLEMFVWTKPRGLKIFNQTLEQAQASKVLAANQGLYNGLLAAGLVWGLLIADSACSKNIEIFFLSCVLIAGIFGGVTASRKIFFVQALPAALSLTAYL